MAVIKNLMVRVGANFSGLINGSKKAQASINNLNKTMSGAQQTMSASVGRMGTSLGKLGKLAVGALSVGALVRFGKSAIDAGSDIAEVQNVVDTAFGSMRDKCEAFADTAIESFGMSTLSAKRTASTYMAMAKSLGLSEGAAAEMSIALAGLSGDVASFYNISQATADTKLKSVFTGETETLKELGVVMTQANLDAYAMAKGYSKTTSAMTQAEKVQLRYAYVTDQLSLAQGDFAKTSASWANQVRILTERWNEFKQSVGQLLINVLRPMLVVLTRIMAVLSDGAKRLATLFGGSGTDAATGIGDLAGSVSEVADGFTEADAAAKALKKTTAGFDELNILSSSGDSAAASSGAGGTAQLPSFDTDKAEKSANRLRTIFAGAAEKLKKLFAPTTAAWSKAFTEFGARASTALGRIRESASGIWQGTLAPFGRYLMTDFVPNVANAFSENFAPVFSDTMAYAIRQFAEDFRWACGIVEDCVENVTRPAFELFKRTGTDAMAAVREEWERSGAKITAKLGEARDKIRNILTQLYEKVYQPIMSGVIARLGDLWDKHLKPLWDSLTQLFGSLSNALLTLWNNIIAPLLRNLTQHFGPTVRTVFLGVWDVFQQVHGRIIDKVRIAVNELRILLDFVTNIFAGNWRAAWGNIKEVFANIWDSMKSKVRSSLNGIISLINLLWRGLYDAIRKVVNTLGKIVGTIGKVVGKDWGFAVPDAPPTIPYLATGGIVERATHIVVGEAGREAVLPLEQNTGWMDQLADRIAARNGQISPGRVVLQVNGKTLAEAVIRSINDLTRQTGETPLVLA